MGDDLFYTKINRREFLKGTGKAAVGLAGLLNGCTPTLKETREHVANQRWNCNPIIPQPNGCYIGGHRGFRQFGPGHRRNALAFGKDIGKLPAFWDITDPMRGQKFPGFNDQFPTKNCEAMVNLGVVPEVGYGLEPFKDFKEIADGKKDSVLEKFFEAARAYGKPYVLVPFKEMNIQDKVWWSHGGEPPKWFVKAYRRMHAVSRGVGANENTVWAVNYMGSYASYARDPEPFYPGDDVVDWIGFTVVNRQRDAYSDFRKLFEADYAWVRTKHGSKPSVVFEFVQSANLRQPEFIRKAYKDLKELFSGVWMAQWWENVFNPGPWKDDQRFSTNPKSLEAMQAAMSDPWFKGGPLGFLAKYK